MVRGTIACIAGDNLGSHYIGGFVENFTLASHLCHHCEVAREQFEADPMEAHCPIRTRAKYDAAIAVLNSDPDLKHHLGVKKNSTFNSLNHFHICQPGLPPCLGHDLFEDVIDYDLSLCINYFIKKNFFTYDILNRRIVNFKYLASDASDKPCEVTPNAHKLGGHAVQNWCLLRLFPLIIGDKIPDLNDLVWQMVILLIRVTALICAPKISHGQVACMKLLTHEYLFSRMTVFPDNKLKPKHHYLSHYPSLTMQFGPLMKSWTMRFESKHSYFKSCIRSAKNFKNITGLLAERHQTFNALQLEGRFFKQPLECNNATPFYAPLYSSDIQEVLRTGQFDSKNTSVSDRCVFKGTVFKKDNFVAIEEAELISFGKILLVLTCDCDLYFVLQQYSAELNEHLQAYEVDLSSMKVACVSSNTLVHELPLNAYNIDFHLYIPLKFSIFDRLGWINR